MRERERWRGGERERERERGGGERERGGGGTKEIDHLDLGEVERENMFVSHTKTAELHKKL